MLETATRRMAAPLAGRDFRLLWVGQTISALGGVLQAVALAWLVLDRTGSAVALSGTLLAVAIPATLLNLAGGVATDRYDPRTVMIWSDVVRAAVVSIIAALAAVDALPLRALYALLVVLGAAGGIFGPAAQSIISRLVPAEGLQAANALSQTTAQVAMILGAPLAGVLVTVAGAELALTTNAASFAVAAVAASAIAPLGRHKGGNARGTALDSAREGLSYVRARPWLLHLLLVDAVLSLAAIGPLAVGLPLLARGATGIGAAGLGLLLAGFGVGSLAGMVWLGSRAPGHHRGRVFCLLQLPQGALLAVLAWAPLPLAVALLAGVGLLGGASAVLYMALIQGRVEGGMMGRVMSLVGLSAGGLVLLSQLASGLVAGAAGPGALFVTAGALMSGAALAGLRSPALRQLD
jgi:DHA3 family tetracycline resistance protein-like MFS transporter